MKIIPVFRPAYDHEEISAAAKVLKSGWVGLGPKTAEFENLFAKYVGSPHAVAVNSCTAALHLALASLNLKPGDEVITTPITFVSTAHAVVYNGAKPVFADVEPDTLNLDPARVEKAVTRRTRAILCVHYAGHSCDLKSLQAIAKTRRIPLIEDAAHACGAKYLNQRIGGTGNVTCFSFHAVKNLATGDGGMITTPSARTDAWLRKMYWLGINKSTWGRSAGKRYAWYYDVELLGYKCHMNDIAAAIGLVQLKNLDKHNRKRRQLAKRYSQALAGISWLTLPVEKEYATSSWHIYKVEVPTQKIRDKLVTTMKQHGISLGVHYFPIHLHRYYRQRSQNRLAVAEDKWRKIATLPLFPGLREKDQDRVIRLMGKLQV